MFGRKLYESRINTTSKRSRKLYEGSTGSPIFDKIRSILVGAFCYGDDGENACDAERAAADLDSGFAAGVAGDDRAASQKWHECHSYRRTTVDRGGD